MMNCICVIREIRVNSCQFVLPDISLWPDERVASASSRNSSSLREPGQVTTRRSGTTTLASVSPSQFHHPSSKSPQGLSSEVSDEPVPS